MFAPPGAHVHAPSGVLQGSKPVGETNLYGEDEAEDRYARRPAAVQSTTGDCRACVRPSRQQHRLKTLQSAWVGEGEYPVEVVLFGA